MPELRIETNLDPDDPLAHQAAADVRAFLAARFGSTSEVPGGHQTWNEQGSAIAKALVNRVIADVQAERLVDAVKYLSEWTGYYLGAFALVADQLLMTALAFEAVDAGSDPDDAESTARCLERKQAIIEHTFRMLVEEHRTL
jgi:hypothetical protein